jgi:multicomponent Na+:H+ antiporter subunit D
MQSNIVLLPVLINLITAIVLLFAWPFPRMQRWIGFAGTLLFFICSVYLVSQVAGGEIYVSQGGNWAAPYGITFVLDPFSALMIFLTAVCGLAVGAYASVSIKSKRVSFGFYPLLQFLLMALSGTFVAGDIFNMYVWFEVILITSFVLITLGGESAQLSGAMKYVTINLLASVIFLTGIAILYGVLGSLNLADLSLKIAELEDKTIIHLTAVLFLVAFGIKSAMFPLYFWLPDSYHTPPAAISALFGGLLTKVGVYAFLRVFGLLFIEDEFIRQLILILAVITMVIGALGAINARNMRLIFSYLIISHIGIMLSGLGVFTTVALAGAVFYMAHDIIAKTNVFFISGLVYKMRGTYHIDKTGGIYEQYPYLSILFAIAMFAVVGTPPLSGFWPKILLLKAGAQTGDYLMLFGIIIASFLTLWAIVRLWSNLFWSPCEKETQMKTSEYERLLPRRRYVLIGSVSVLLVATLTFSFLWPALMPYFETIADQLINHDAYINAVMQ